MAPDGLTAPGPGRVLRLALVGVLVSVTLLQRFGLNLGSYSLNAALPAMYGLLILAAFNGVLAVSTSRLVLVAIGIGLALASAIANEERTSIASLELLVAIYLPLAFVLTPGSGVTHERVTRTFSNLALLCAVAGVIQFYAQLVIHADWLFDFTDHIPALLRGPTGYNTAIPVGSLYKSNGFFFREPSGFSFMMALGLMTECLSFRRIGRIVCFAFALLLSYSGTGLLALLVGMLVPMNRKTLLWLAAVACVGTALFWLLDGPLNLSFTVARLDEFGSEHSSGYIRYVAPARLIGDTARIEPGSLLLGHGPGAISRKEIGYEFHDPTWAKLTFEYGALGLIAFVTLFAQALRRPLAPLRIRAMLFAAWLIMGGHLLSPDQTFLSFALLSLVPEGPTQQPMVVSPIAPPHREVPAPSGLTPSRGLT